MSGSNVYGLRLLRQPPVQRAVLAILTIGILIYRAAQFLYWTGQPVWGYDFSAYWTAARHLLTGQPIYTPEQLAGPYAAQAANLFLNPPALAALVTPLAVLFPTDPRLANWGWIGLGAAALVASVLALVRSEGLDDRFPLLRGRGRWWLVAGAFAFPPVVDELVVGNVNLLLLGLMTAAWLGLRRGAGGEGLAGLGVGAAAVVKVFPGLLILWFALTRRWQAVAWSILAVPAIVVIAFPITGLHGWLDYPTVLANISLTSQATDALAPTFWLAPYLGFTVARILVTGLGLALIAVAALAAPRTLEGARLSFAIAVTVSILITPALYTSYLTVLVLPLILGLAAGVPRRWLALAYVLMWGGQQPALGDLEWIVTRALPTAGALLLLWVLFAAVLGNETRHSGGSEHAHRHGGDADDEPAHAVGG